MPGNLGRANYAALLARIGQVDAAQNRLLRMAVEETVGVKIRQHAGDVVPGRGRRVGGLVPQHDVMASAREADGPGAADEARSDDRYT